MDRDNKFKKIITLNTPVQLLNAYSELSLHLGVSRNALMLMALNDYLSHYDTF